MSYFRFKYSVVINEIDEKSDSWGIFFGIASDAEP